MDTWATSQPSSPILKARRKACEARKHDIMRRLLLFGVAGFVLWYLLFQQSSSQYLSPDENEAWQDHSFMIQGPSLLGMHEMDDLPMTETLPLLPVMATLFNSTPSSIEANDESAILPLTAILPVTAESKIHLRRSLHKLSTYDVHVSEIVIVAPWALHSEIRVILRTVIDEYDDEDEPTEYMLFPWLPTSSEEMVSLRAARQVKTDLVLFLSSNTLDNSDNLEDLLSWPQAAHLDRPFGPFTLPSEIDAKLDCLPSSDAAYQDAFLVPPFIMRSRLIPPREMVSGSGYLDVWRSLGLYIAQEQRGAVLTTPTTVAFSCPVRLPDHTNNRSDPRELPFLDSQADICTNTSHSENVRSLNYNFAGSRGPNLGLFLLLMPSLVDLGTFSAAVCRLLSDGHQVIALLHSVTNTTGVDPLTFRTANLSDCSVKYAVRPLPPIWFTAESNDYDWTDAFDMPADIIIASAGNAVQEALLVALAKRERGYHAPTLIHLPRSDLPYTDWMGSLSLQEWRNWHIPRVDVSVVTNDRPWSLARLLASLSSARFFGDSLDLRINLEQMADAETMSLAGNFTWDHGRVFIHHRVVHGGLLTAVAESWYPHTNDSYGLILEDDVELSPLFYAWIKMSLLHYRYGDLGNSSPRLFGISLYQQKNLELRPEGRHPFNARNTFAAVGLLQPSTPYLSQIPCSWGALYFPEHWREFHAYLAFRLSEYAWPLETPIVPTVRSNNWTRSWKKYFIELAYLRGYAMLYPNFADYMSLSTNHLEAGSHVKDAPTKAYLRKKQMFLLPLMQLPEGAELSARWTGLLDLPEEKLPGWTTLPHLDLFGLISDEATLVQRGLRRREELISCSSEMRSQFDTRELLCTANSSGDKGQEL